MIEERVLKEKRLQAQNRVSLAVHATAKHFYSLEDRTTKDLVYGLEARLMADALGQKDFKVQVPVNLHRDVYYPANPWEHFKLWHTPRWFKARWPVVWTRVEVRGVVNLEGTFSVDFEALYPALPIKQEPVVVMAIYHPPKWSDPPPKWGEPVDNLKPSGLSPSLEPFFKVKEAYLETPTLYPQEKK